MNKIPVADKIVHLNGDDSLDAEDIESRRVDIEIGGGSDAIIWVTEALVLKANGGSKVQSKGER